MRPKTFHTSYGRLDPPWGTKIPHFVWEAGPPVWYDNFTLRVGGWIPREPPKNSHFVWEAEPPVSPKKFHTSYGRLDPPWAENFTLRVGSWTPAEYENFTLRMGGWIPREPRKNFTLRREAGSPVSPEKISHFVGRLDPP